MPEPNKVRYFRWYHIYYILAVFGLATISFSLLLNQTIIEKYNASIEMNRQWSLRLKLISELSRMAADVNTPGNDVFENKDVAGEKQKLEMHLTNLNKKLRDVRGQFQWLGLLDTNKYPALDADLQTIEKRLNELAGEARKTMVLFEQNRTDEAGRQMAVMDRCYYNASSALRNFYLHLTDIQKESFAGQSKELGVLRRLEQWIAGAVMLAILAITFYGHKLAKQITRDEGEKERHVVALQSANDGLERKTDELQTALADLQAAQMRVSEFYSTVSHELRTPLTSIRGSLGLIGGGLTGEISAETESFVKIAIDETDRLIRLINGILDLRKLEAGMLELIISRVNSGELIEKTLNNLGGFAHSNGVELIFEERAASASLPDFECDEDRILQVLTNLVSNAIKFSSKEQCVYLSVKAQEPDRIRFSIRDNGCGIPEDQQYKLFGKFQQVDQSDRRKKDGSGLGLAISKAIVEQHGGEIGFESDGKSGATFWFELPRKSAAGATES